jgi:hypothetical protein
VRRAVLLALLVLLGSVLAGSSACRYDRLVLAPADTVYVTKVDSVHVAHTDTLLIAHVDTITRARTDTLYRLRVDTLYRLHVDTLVRVDTLVSPPVHDTTLIRRTDTVTVTRVDTLTRLVHDTTIVQRTDTLFLPSAVVHDSSWVYVQQNPTNPLGGGDPKAGVAWIDTPTMLPAGFAFALVFWHGNFVGIVSQVTPVDPTSPTGHSEYWEAWPYLAGGGTMPYRGRYPTKLEAIQALMPIVLTLPAAPMTLLEIARLFLFVREAGQNAGQRVKAIQMLERWREGTGLVPVLLRLRRDDVLDLYYQGQSPDPARRLLPSHLRPRQTQGVAGGRAEPEDVFLYVNADDHAHHVGLVSVAHPLQGVAGNTSKDGTSSNGDGCYEHFLLVDPSRIKFVRLPT